MDMNRLKNYTRYICMLAAGVLLSAAALAQGVKVDATLEGDKILIGDQVKLTVQAEHPAGIRIKWPALKDSIGKLEIIEQPVLDTLSAPGSQVVKERQTYIITSFDTGYYPVPPFVIRYHTGSDTATSVTETQALLLSVYAPKVDTTQAIKDIKGPMDVPFTFRDAVPYIIGGMVLAGIILLIYYLLRKRKKGEKLFVPSAPPRPAHEIAIAQLHALEKEKVWQTGNYKLYHTRLADIIRTYIEDRYGIRAMELTSDETLAGLRSMLRDEQYEPLAQILRLSDLVKFAKVQPLPAENELSLRNAFGFVQSSIPAGIADDRNVENKTTGNA